MVWGTQGMSPHLPWALAGTGGAVGQGVTLSLVSVAQAVGGAPGTSRFLLMSQRITRGLWQRVCGDVPCQLCHMPEQTGRPDANGQVGEGSAISLSA